MGSWKAAYEKWLFWKTFTRELIRPHDMVLAVSLWRRFKAWVRAAQQEHPTIHHRILESLQPGLSLEDFVELVGNVPFSLLAFLSVHKERYSGIVGGLFSLQH